MRARIAIHPLCGTAFALLAFSCVDTDGERPTEATHVDKIDPGSGPVDCAADDAYQFYMLDDFELGAAAGTWYANNDVCENCQALAEKRDKLNAVDAGTVGADADAGVAVDGELADLEKRLAKCRVQCDASSSPTIFDKPLPAARIQNGGRCDSQYAMRLQTTELLGWGANLGDNLAPPFDATGWEGLSFWARRAPDSRGTVRVEVADKYTDGTYFDETNQHPCVLVVDRDKLEEGCDRFGGYALVGTDWKFFTLPFDELRQAGWGVKAPELDLFALRTLTFLFSTGAWDIWIDDVAFYKRRAN